MSAAIAVRGDLQLGVERARAILAKCKNVDEAKNIRDQAAAMKAYLRQQGAARDVQNDAAEIKLRAERRIGELLIESKESGERQSAHRPKELHGATVSNPPTLSDLGIEKTAAKRWQDVARIPEEKFEGYLRDARVKQDGELTTKGALSAGREPREENPVEPFHILIAIGDLKDAIRELADEWPADRRHAIPEALRDLATEFEVSNAG